MTDAHFAESTTTDRCCADPLCELPRLDRQQGCGDTWMTVGDTSDPGQELTVTVVFERDPLDDFDTGEYLLRALEQQFPGHR